MTLIGNITKDGLRGVRQAGTLEDLALINSTDCAAVVWQRRPLSAFQSWIDAQYPGDLPRARVVIRPDRMHAAVSQLLHASGLHACAERQMLADDIAAQAQVFAEATAAPYLRLRLEVITTNACRKFHTDALTARLVCTYRGKGTQYGRSLNGEDPREVFTVPTGSPIVLRGSEWPETPASGLKYRSPPIEGSEETRMVLVLDPVFGLGDQDDIVLH